MRAVTDHVTFSTQDRVLQGNCIETPARLKSAIHLGTLHHINLIKNLQLVYLLSFWPIQGPITTTPIELHLPIHDVGDVSPVTQELHDLLPFPGKLCPAGTCLRILLQPSPPLPFKLEIDLPQSGSAGTPDRITPTFERDRPGVFYQRLPPHRNQSLF